MKGELINKIKVQQMAKENAKCCSENQTRGTTGSFAYKKKKNKKDRGLCGDDFNIQVGKKAAFIIKKYQ